MTGPAPSAGGSVDAVVVGAGFGGLYALHTLRGLGLRTRVFEAGGGIGGTWYWNRYPGARCDVPSIDYSYSFDEDLQREWRWSERYAAQPEILRYLEHVADRFDLRRDITVDTRVVTCDYAEDTGRWRVRTDTGETVDTQFLIMATGCLSVPKTLEVPGRERFTGRSLHTFHWPREGVDLTGQRVGVIGTGSSAVQSIPLIGRQAAELTVFQRTPTFVQPAGNRPVTDREFADITARYPEYRAAARRSGFGVPTDIDPRSAVEVGEAERNARYRQVWGDGLVSVATAYADIVTDRASNETAADFVRARMAEVVVDPELVTTLSPDYAYACKRPCLDNTETGFYELFNRPGVDLVDLRATPLVEITETGIRTTDRHHELDAIVYATGFDAMTGALTAFDISGRDGVTLRERWVDGPRGYLGLAVAGFPNLFTITGPGSPSVVTNMVVSIEDHVDLVADLIADMRVRGRTEVEATPAAQDGWTRHIAEIAATTLYPETASWYTGANVAGKPNVLMIYVGGVAGYRAECAEIVADDYRGFAFR